MTTLITRPMFPELLARGVPLLDVRSPVEFRRGALPGAVCLPLLSDAEREAVGRRHRAAGGPAAVALGRELVRGPVRAERIEGWLAWLADRPEACLHCFRGGLRSTVAQQWLREAGRPAPRVEGGYKALRRFLLETLERTAEDGRFLVLGGRTGSGKTRLLARLPERVDLEGRANHRGSAFGARAGGQPGQADFENLLACDLLRLGRRARIVIEDESRTIGSLAVPGALHRRMQRSPLAVVEEPLERRIAVILDDYVRAGFRECEREGPETAHERFAGRLTGALERIRRRLGGERHAAAAALMRGALARQRAGEGLDGHRAWIGRLLTHYYDPMYEHQLGKKLGRVVFRGGGEEFLRWAAAGRRSAA